MNFFFLIEDTHLCVTDCHLDHLSLAGIRYPPKIESKHFGKIIWKAKRIILLDEKESVCYNVVVCVRKREGKFSLEFGHRDLKINVCQIAEKPNK